MSVPQSLVDFVTGFSDFARSKHIINLIRLSILDWAAVGIKGGVEPVSKVVLKMVSDEFGAKESSVFGSRIRLPARSAALLNGVTSHALDYDDTNFLYLGHPGVVVNSAVFSIANKIDLSLNKAMQCSIIGSEVAARLGVWLGREHYNRGYHITATAGVFGAAMGCSRVLGLSRNSTKNALSLASSKASGLKVQFGTMAKPYHAGMAASSGVEVALLALHGLDACENSLEGEYGFGALYGVEPSLPKMIFPIDDFLFTKVKYKFHACCHGTHAAIEALDHLKRSHYFQSDEIESISISVNTKFVSVCNIQKPKSGLQIKFSYRMIAAMQILGYDTSNPNSFSDEICADKQLNKIRKKIDVYFSDKLKESEAKVAVCLVSGNLYVRTHDLDDLIEFNELESKVRGKAKNIIGREAELEIWDMLKDETISSNKFMQFLANCS